LLEYWPSLLAAKRQRILGHIMSTYSRSGLGFAEVLDAAAFPGSIEAIAATFTRAINQVLCFW
jgi:hypothetical protein